MGEPGPARTPTESRIREALAASPDLADRIARQLLIVLHSEGHVSIDTIYEEARASAGHAPAAPAHDDPNRPGAAPWSAGEKDAVREVVLRHAAERLPPERVDDVVAIVRRREEAEGLESIASLPDVSFAVLADRVRRFCKLPRGSERLAPAQTTGLRVALTRSFISDQLEFIGVAKNYLRVTDFEWILDRVIGPAKGQGRIGGKAAGMFLGHRVLQGEHGERHGEEEAQVNLPESWFIRSDVIEQFMHLNRLDEYQSQKYKPAEEVRNEYPLVRQIFQEGEFPAEIVTQLEALLTQIGPHPVIVRSSSLLEDRFGAAFSGMYASVFLGNQGPLHGLGTRAVDRTGNDHCRLVALGAPTMRPEVSPERQARYSQRFVDVIDLEDNRFGTIPLERLLEEGMDAPGLEVAASVRTADGLIEPTGSLSGASRDKIILTFDRLLARTRFARLMRDRLRRLEDVYGTPMNVEFAQVEDSFYLLQCRPLVQAEAADDARLPRGVAYDRVIFATRGMVRSGVVRDIEYVVLVDPRAYEVADAETRIAVARVVARINDALEGKSFLLMGPGRWGSNDPRLGVKVAYADINHCSVLIEIAHRRGDFVPEVSYGTHFFQDLVEDGIYYLALHPEDEGGHWRAEFVVHARNAVGELSPADARMEHVVHVVRVADAAPGRSLHLAMDGEAGEAMCWLE